MIRNNNPKRDRALEIFAKILIKQKYLSKLRLKEIVFAKSINLITLEEALYLTKYLGFLESVFVASLKEVLNKKSSSYGVDINFFLDALNLDKVKEIEVIKNNIPIPIKNQVLRI